MLLEAMPEGASWVCLSRNGTEEREIQHLKINNEGVVPAGWAVVVARGAISFEDKLAEQLAYIRPRDVDYIASGTADLLLVR
jgi:hypothetical protein